MPLINPIAVARAMEASSVSIPRWTCYTTGPKEAIKRGEAGMSAYKSDFLRVLAERGFIHQVSDAEGLDAKAAAGPLTAYVGFDATAPSLHIGNLLTIMMLRWLQKSGHRPIALMGGGTSKIGDRARTPAEPCSPARRARPTSPRSAPS